MGFFQITWLNNEILVFQDVFFRKGIFPLAPGQKGLRLNENILTVHEFVPAWSKKWDFPAFTVSFPYWYILWGCIIVPFHSIHAAKWIKQNNITLDSGILLSMKRYIKIHHVRFQGFGWHTVEKQHCKLNWTCWGEKNEKKTHSTNRTTWRLRTWTSSFPLVPFRGSTLLKEKDPISKGRSLQYWQPPPRAISHTSHTDACYPKW